MWNDDEKQVWGKVTCPKENKNATKIKNIEKKIKRNGTKKKKRIKSLVYEFGVLCMFEGPKTEYMAFVLFHNVVRRLE